MHCVPAPKPFSEIGNGSPPGTPPGGPGARTLLRVGLVVGGVVLGRGVLVDGLSITPLSPFAVMYRICLFYGACAIKLTSAV